MAEPTLPPDPASADLPTVRAAAEKIGVGRASRHLFLCALPTKPKCASYEATEEVWEHVKRRMKELGLGAPGGTGPCVLRSKVDCLRVCTGGPIAVVYPEGTWYHHVTIPVMERILTEHLLQGRPVREHVLLDAPLREGD